MRYLSPLLAGVLVVASLGLVQPARADVVELPGFDRSLHLEHAENARDIGGWQTADGHWVRTGAAFRSGKLGDLADAEWQDLRERGVDHIVDFRNISEKSQSPDDPPADFTYQEADVVGIPPTGEPQLSDLLALVHCAGLATVTGALDILATMDDYEDVGTAEGYLLEACWPGAMTAFRETMTALADPTQTVIIHCSAGKDRTGVATAILLTILGVPWETVLHDFDLSNTYRGPGSVQTEWLQAWYDAVIGNWGSFDSYVSHGLGLSGDTVAALRARFLTEEPTGPADPPADGPGDPDQPDQPDQPDKPDEPGDPGDPSDPSDPGDPGDPGGSDGKPAGSPATEPAPGSGAPAAVPSYTVVKVSAHRTIRRKPTRLGPPDLPARQRVVRAAVTGAADGVVTVRLDGRRPRTVALSAGTATFRLPKHLRLGRHVLRVEYAGSETTLPSSVQRTIRIKPVR